MGGKKVFLMQTGLPSKDSLSRSTPDMGLYSVQNGPKRVPVGERVDKGLPSKESWQGVEKNVFDRLTESGILLPDSTLMMTAQMGKTVVLLLLLPGQLLLFTLPKWVAFEILPKMVEKLHETVQAMVNLTQKLVTEPLAKGVAFIEQTFTQWKEKTVQQFTKVARAVNEIVEPMVKGARDAVKLVYQTIALPVKAAASVVTKGAQAIKRAGDFVADKINVVGEKIVEAGAQVVAAAKVLAQPVKQIFSILAKQAAVFPKIAQAIQERIEGLVETFRPIIKKIREFRIPLKIPLPKKIPIPNPLTPLKKVASKLKALLAQALDRDFVPEVLKNIAFSQIPLNIWINIMTPFLAEGIIGKQLVHFVSWVKSIASKVGKLKESLFSMINSGSEFLKQAAKKIFTYGMKAARFAWEKAKIVYSWAMVAARLLFRLLNWLLYCFRVLFAIVKVIAYSLAKQLRRDKHPLTRAEP